MNIKDGKITLDGFVLTESTLHNDITSSALLGITSKDGINIGHDNKTWVLEETILCDSCNICVKCQTCNACDGGCYQCTSCNACQGCTTTCTGCTSCNGSCFAGCVSCFGSCQGCTSSCQSSCASGCFSACETSCQGCNTTCYNACVTSCVSCDGCTTACQTCTTCDACVGCTGNYQAGCTGSCQNCTGCASECYNSCNSGCTTYCQGCTGSCQNCTGCASCTSCQTCTACDGCQTCTECVSCHGCTGCNGCHGCQSITGACVNSVCLACTDCNTCTGGGGSYSCGKTNDGAYIVDPTCYQTKDPSTPVDGKAQGSEGKRFSPLQPGEERLGYCDSNTTVVLKGQDGTFYNEHLNSDGGSTLEKIGANGLPTGEEETRNKNGTRTSSKAKDGSTTYYGPDGKTPTSKTYPDGGKINYDSKGNPISYTSPSGVTSPLDGPPGC